MSPTKGSLYSCLAPLVRIVPFLAEPNQRHIQKTVSVSAQAEIEAPAPSASPVALNQGPFTEFEGGA